MNSNIEHISGTLRAVGPVDGHVTLDNGRRQSFHLDGVMFYLAPAYLRFDLKKLGDTQILIGSNETRYWVYVNEEDAWHCGRHDTATDLAAELPIRPLELIDALGLTPIPKEGTGAFGASAVQRIVEDYQQILFVFRDESGSTELQKEYWLDRYPPQLVGRVVFRDEDGGLEMESRLSEYRRLGPGGPLLPHVIEVTWPRTQTRIRFSVRSWGLVPQVSPNSIQFATPRKCDPL